VTRRASLVRPSILVCRECGYPAYIQRRLARLKKEGHVKHLYCPSCKRTTAHIEKGER